VEELKEGGGVVSLYSELVKNFEKIRGYMREFYIYGFKSREQYSEKSTRSYDDERRRVESWLGEHMRFLRTKEGKSVFISIDSRVISHNPFYKALKAKSFTDGDITLHFLFFDILSSPEIKLTLPEIISEIDLRLSGFDEPMTFDESTVRKKLAEYARQGTVVVEKCGKKAFYSRAADPELPEMRDALCFFSEVVPCGALGSFLLDKYDAAEGKFGFKHHYISSAIDSDVTAALFEAMHKKCEISFCNHSRRASGERILKVLPLRIFESVQNGRAHLLAYSYELGRISAFRIDYISGVKIGKPSPLFDWMRRELDSMQKYMWGVNSCRDRYGKDRLERVEFTLRVGENEEYIVNRLEREKRVGQVERLDGEHYRFSAQVYDINEMVPWIRSFICRITALEFSDKALEKQFKEDIEQMYRMYGIGEDRYDIQ